MNMRRHDRIPVSFEVIIDYQALGLLRGKVLNLSKNGMYITTVAISICDYSNIELCICQTEISGTPLHFSATVIHSDEQGIGVMYDENQQLSKRFLQPFNTNDFSHQLLSTAL